MISAAEITNVDAIHPGYGFLSENAGFAEVCEISGIKFIGPTPAVIRAMGVKDCARGIMRDAGVPILPGSDGVLGSAEEAVETARRIGYPVIVKASAGGGGRGMRIVREPSDMASQFAQAQQEAGAAFSCADVYLEKFIEAPRHIEFQVLADEHGNVEILGERECSIQRRHQKLIEESPLAEGDQGTAPAHLGPAPGGDEGRRIYQRRHGGIPDGRVGRPVFHRSERAHPGGASGDRGGDRNRSGEEPVADRGGRAAARYHRNAGEVPRPLDRMPHQCGESGHVRAIAGPHHGLNLPGGIGVRVDTAAYQDCVIPPYYDSLVAKLITHGRDRAEAISRMNRALGMFVVEGIHTSIPMQQRIMRDPDFVAGEFDTNFVKRFMPAERQGVKAKV